MNFDIEFPRSSRITLIRGYLRGQGVVDVLHVGGVQPQRHPLARLGDIVQVDARYDVADGECDRLGVEHDGMRWSCVRALQPQVVLVERGGTLQVAASALHSALEAVLRPLGMTITHYACLELLAQRPAYRTPNLPGAPSSPGSR
jgi:hypothetical protein